MNQGLIDAWTIDFREQSREIGCGLGRLPSNRNMECEETTVRRATARCSMRENNGGLDLRGHYRQPTYTLRSTYYTNILRVYSRPSTLPLSAWRVHTRTHTTMIHARLAASSLSNDPPPCLARISSRAGDRGIRSRKRIVPPPSFPIYRCLERKAVARHVFEIPFTNAPCRATFFFPPPIEQTARSSLSFPRGPTRPRGHRDKSDGIKS